MGREVSHDQDNPLPPPEGFTLRHSGGIKRVLRADPCAFCGEAGGTVDHIRPAAAMGGPTHWTNLTGACLACNMDKGSDTLLGFLLRRCGLVGDPGHLRKKPTKLAKQQARKRKFAAAAPMVGRKTRRARRVSVYW